MRSAVEVRVARDSFEAGLDDQDIARRMGIPRRTISEWRRRPRWIASRLEPTKCSCGARHDFERLPKESYAYLLGIYLGDGCISETHRPGVWRLRITLDTIYPDIIEECGRSMEALLPSKKAHRQQRYDCRCVEVGMYWKHWPCLIPQHGPGKKHSRRIELSPWQQALIGDAHQAFLRGLIHSDGTRIIATERKGSYVRRAPRYAFSNRSEDIKRLFCQSCDALEIRWTRPSDCQIAVYRLDSVSRLDEFIGPKS